MSMKCPKYIRDALKARASSAKRFNEKDLLISKWIDDHNIEVPSEDYHGGAESIAHPYDSMLSVLQCIEEA